MSDKRGTDLIAGRRILVTGAAGFIGYHVSERLLALGATVVGLDGMTPYYDVRLKRARLERLAGRPGFSIHEFMLEDAARLMALVAETRPDVVIHLAAQAGVRAGVENPRAFIESNVVGTFNLLEACRETRPSHLLLASTSSVYGDGGSRAPSRETDETSRPLSLYAATKKSTEVIAHAYAHLHGLPTTAFRFFTVYGPWGRPDMAIFKFTAAILDGRAIEIYGEGRMQRDFTYVDDIVAGIVGLVNLPPPAPGAQEGGEGARGDVAVDRETGLGAPAGGTDDEPGLSPSAPFRIVNIGAAQPVELLDFIAAIEAAAGRPAERVFLPMQRGDVRRTHADSAALRRLVTLPPATPVGEGVRAFVDWYRGYYGV
ncbi:MAG TPA: NAD-dependent epimerase/dehydratase family protein [Bauldia sp.]|nr:NAD-dependent epimerase/dehydratase family protein [Bauldia sp.]